MTQALLDYDCLLFPISASVLVISVDEDGFFKCSQLFYSSFILCVRTYPHQLIK